MSVEDDDNLLSIPFLKSVTGKKRPHCQKAWFKAEFGVDLPANSQRVIISKQLFEALQAKRAGLLAPDNAIPQSRPKVHMLRKNG